MWLYSFVKVWSIKTGYVELFVMLKWNYNPQRSEVFYFGCTLSNLGGMVIMPHSKLPFCRSDYQ